GALVQNEIQNIYLSIIYANDDEIFDATNEYFRVYNSQVLTIDGLKYYKIRFNRNYPDNSYWQISALNASLENASIKFAYIENGEIKTEEDSANLDAKYMPLYVLPEILPTVDWAEGKNLLTSAEIVGSDANKSLLLLDDEQKYIPLYYENVQNLANITNLGDKPAYRQAIFFAYSKTDLTKVIENCVKYEGIIDGISDDIFEIVLDNEGRLKIFDLGTDDLENKNSVVSFNLIFAIIKHDAIGNPVLDEEGYYQLVAIPETPTGELNYIPFEISKVANVNNISFKPIENEKLNGQIVQQKENNLIFEITLDESDVKIFNTQVEDGHIYLQAQIRNGEVYENFDGIYLNDNGKVDLKNTLSYCLSALKNATHDFCSFIDNTLKITLSTDQINYSSNEKEKDVRIVVVYEASEDTIYAPTTTPQKIYSGKIDNLKLVYGEGEDDYFALNTEVDINVDKSINEGTAYIYNDAEINLFDSNKHLNILVTGYGIDDTYSVESSNSNVIKVQFDGMGYLLNPVNGGTASVIIKPKYAVNASKVIKLNFTVNADYSTIGSIDENYEFNDDESTKQSNIILGLLDFDTITNDKIKVKENDSSNASFVNNFKYSCTVLNEDILNYIQFTYENDELTGFNIKKHLEMPAMFIVYYSNDTYSIFGAVSVVINPYYTLNCDISAHDGAEKKNNSSATAVFAETEIELEGLQILGNGSAENANGKILVLNGKTLSGFNNGQSLSIQTIGKVKYQSSKWYVIFNPVGELTEYDLTFTIDGNSSEDSYAFNKTFKVCVNPNIKLTDSFAESLTEEDGIYVLNDEEHPFKQGDEIAWPSGAMAENTHYIELNRIYGSASFDVEKFECKVSLDGGETYSNISSHEIYYKISGITKLTEVYLKLTYGGKEFEFKFWAEPNISTDSLEKVIYNGKEYISLYAGQSGLNNFNSQNISLTAGDLISNGTVLSLNNLIKHLNNDLGIILTKVTITITSSNTYIIRDCIIFPENWSYINYTGSEETDVYKILSGSVKAVINSNDEIANFATILNGKTLNNENGFSYAVYENGVKLENKNLIYVETVDGKAVIKTNYAGEDHNYKLEFTVYVSGGENYKFNYYVQVVGTQKIEINYPFENATQHTIYYSQFARNNQNKYEYVLDLNSKEWNLQNNNYVQLKNGNADGDFKDLEFAISLKVNMEEVSKENISNFVEISEDGKLKITNNADETLEITVNITTEVGAQNQYKILVQPDKSLELKKPDTSTDDPDDLIGWPSGDPDEQFVFTNAYSWEAEGNNKKIDLTDIKLIDVTNGESPVDGLKWAVVSTQTHTLQTSSNSKIYVSETKLVAEPSPNTETGILVAYTKDGIVKTFGINLTSNYTVTFTTDDA
ncbi:MAG: hypothetical protein J5779_02050, partial [Clostridia bacterium]|nr:hypothetical protein [Clostridia bacterium]